MKIAVFFYFLSLLLIIPREVFPQMLTQTVRGKVVDEDSKSPVTGANVIILNSEPLRGTVTDAHGNFRLENVPLGRIDIQVRFLGYEEKTIPNILVSSAREVILNPGLKESVLKMNEVVVIGRKSKGNMQNEMAIISSRSFSVGETKRYAGSVQDPSRMVSAYAGVTSDPMGNNDIVIRGNSPKGILWRMDGIEIPNPNHLANEGATGGPISALNSELLANSDFYTGAFSPEYGDVLSGVFDLKMRSGNNEKHEYSVGIGVLGTDIMAEGPFRKGNEGSWLFNYRYSSLSLLDQAGIVDFDGVPKFQDAAFKIVLPTKRSGTFSLFGLGGTSSMNHNQPESKESERIVEKRDFGANLGVLGMNHTLPLSRNAFLHLSLAASANGSYYSAEEIDDFDRFNFKGDGNWNKSNILTNLMFSSKINASHRIVAGMKYTEHFYNMDETYFNNDLRRVVSAIDMKKHAGDFQTWLSWKYRQTDGVTWVGGFRTMYFSLNRKLLFEPRLALRWQITSRQAINAGFGQHSKTESMITYFTNIHNNDGSYTTPNTDLGLSKARHFVLGYEYRFSGNLNSRLDLYYQKLYDIPVENNDTSSYSLLNSDEGYIDKELINAGTGKNYGIEYTLERYYSGNFYFLVTASLYQSVYKALEDKVRNTRYNGNYAFNFLTGKEFKLGKGNRANAIGINAKFFFNGGRRYIPVDLEASRIKGETVYDYSRAWNNKLDDIKQVNLSFSYRINRPKSSHELIIDVMNVTNEQARSWELYNKYTRELDYYRQLYLIPNIMYRVHF